MTRLPPLWMPPALDPAGSAGGRRGRRRAQAARPLQQHHHHRRGRHCTRAAAAHRTDAGAWARSPAAAGVALPAARGDSGAGDSGCGGGHATWAGAWGGWAPFGGCCCVEVIPWGGRRGGVTDGIKLCSIVSHRFGPRIGLRSHLEVDAAGCCIAAFYGCLGAELEALDMT